MKGPSRPRQFDRACARRRYGERVAVLVIGGGPAGCAAAHALAERGHGVTLLEAEQRLERGERLAVGASGDACAARQVIALVAAKQNWVLEKKYSPRSPSSRCSASHAFASSSVIPSRPG